MNFRKLLTYLTVGTAAVIPFAGAQNPTILQGSYISNVFGNSNFVKNPNAQTNVANVTNATRSTTTPLVATSEFNLSLDAGQNATWTLRTFDAGMKGQNCEARFSYRGFATATTTAEIVQNSLVVAQLVLTPSTDPRIASINFPCGDLANATTFRIAQTTANMTGTNEIGAIYTGLATNMANVAQAEFYGSMEHYGNASCSWVGAGTGTATSANANCNTFASEQGTTIRPATNIPGIRIVPAKAGNYQITGSINQYAPAAVNGQGNICQLYQNGSLVKNATQAFFASTSNYGMRMTFVASVSLNAGTTYDFDLRCDTTSTLFVRSATEANQWSVYRFPTSSELVVTPERQNTFAAASWTGSQDFTRSSTTEITISDAVFATNRNAYGKAQFTGTANDVAITVPQMPAGTYKIELTAEHMRVQQAAAGSLDANCSWYLKDGTNTAQAQSILYGIQFTIDAVSTASQIVKYTSVADRTFTASLASGTTNSTLCGIKQPKIIITPLDQPSNSALYVQGPVLGSQTGAAIPAGYVGEVKSSVVTTGVNMTSVTWTEITGLSVTLTPGVWMVQATGYTNKNAAATTAFEIACALGASSADISGNYAATQFYRVRTGQEINSFAAAVGNSMSIRPFYVRSDGTNLYFADGTTFISASQTIKAACYTGAWTGGPYQASGTIEAVRIN